LLDAIRYILSNDTNHNSNEIQLTDEQVQIFEIIEQLRVSPQTMFMYLNKHFTKHFDIDLYIIAFDKGAFPIINPDNHDKANMAFLSFNEHNTVRGPVYIKKDNGTTQTIFSSDDDCIQIDVYMYLSDLSDSSKLFF
jgi:hypothetical protein